MQGFFGCSIADKHDAASVSALVAFIEGLDHTVFNRHVIGETEAARAKIFKEVSGLEYNTVNARRQDLDWVMASEFAVFEISNGSWGGGIEFDHATVVRHILDLEPIPILCLIHEARRPSWLISGLVSNGKSSFHHSLIGDLPTDNISLRKYRDLDHAQEIIADFLKPAQT